METMIWIILKQFPGGLIELCSPAFKTEEECRQVAAKLIGKETCLLSIHSLTLLETPNETRNP